MVLGSQLFRGKAVEVTADDERHDADLGRSDIGGSQLLGNRETGCEIGVRMLDLRRGDDMRRVADAGEPEVPAMQLVGDLVRQPRPVGAVEHADVNRGGGRGRRWMRRLHARHVAGPQRRGVVAPERLPAEPTADGEGDDEEQKPPATAAPPGFSPGRQVASS